MTLVKKEPSKITYGDIVPKYIKLGDTQVRPTVPPYLCFTANEANSRVRLTQEGTPRSITLETSTDGQNWNTYTLSSWMYLTNVGDKVYIRNTSTDNIYFSQNESNYYYFIMTGSIAASGDVTYLINKNGTDTISPGYTFAYLFKNCSSLISSPRIPIKTMPIGAQNCCAAMFTGCTNLETIPALSTTGALPGYCYSSMFNGCSKIKLSETQTGEYQNEYRFPTTGTITSTSNSTKYMFANTGGTYIGTGTYRIVPENTTYYTSNTVV